MSCNPESLTQGPLLRGSMKKTPPHGRTGGTETIRAAPAIYKMGDNNASYVDGYRAGAGHHPMRDHREVVDRRPEACANFRFRCHARTDAAQTNAGRYGRKRNASNMDRNDIGVLLQRKRWAGWTDSRARQAVSRSQRSWCGCGNRNPNEVMRKKATFGQRIADRVADSAVRDVHPHVSDGLVIYTVVNITLKG